MKLQRDVFVGLAAVAWADGVVTDEEASALDAAAKACGLADDDLAKVREATHARVELDRLEGLELGHAERMYVYAIGCWLARADGKVDDSELDLLSRLRDLLGLSDHDCDVARRAQADTGTNSADLKVLARSIEEVAQEERDARPEALPLPPGTFGWPLLGETLAFVPNPFGWVDARVKKHGPIFRSRVLGRRVAVIAGPEANALWIDQERIERDGGMFDHVLKLFGGVSLPNMDGDEHLTRRHQVLAGFSRKALAHYLPDIQSIVERRVESWASAGEIGWIAELRQLAIEIIARNMVGLPAGPELEQVVADYGAVTRGFGSIPVSLPGTTMYKAEKARDRLVSFMEERVAERRDEPTHDGLSLILGAEYGKKKSRIDDHGAALELHHLFLAGYIVFAEIAAMIIQLDRSPKVLEALRKEVDATKGPVTLEMLHGMELLTRVVLETKRITPMLPILFGRAREDIAFAGKRIPKGWQVSLALAANHQLPDVYPSPDEFDPDRFSEGRREHDERPHAFAPQGPGAAGTSHACVGIDYSTVIMQAFMVVLLRSYRWELPKQELGLNMALIPPEPKDGLRAKLTKR